MSVESALIIGDVQAPCHDKRAWEVAMQIGEDLKPNRLVINGDLIEFRNLSVRYAAKVDKKWGASAREEVESARELLEEAMRRIKPDKAFFNEGNHEWRLFRVLSQMPQGLQVLGISPKIARELSIEAILGLESLGIKYSGPYPNGVWLFNRRPENNVYVHHSYATAAKAGYAAQRDMEKRLCSTITGHGERLACVWRRGLERAHIRLRRGQHQHPRGAEARS